MFYETMKHGAGTVEVPVPPIYIKEIIMLLRHCINVQVGVDVNGNNSLPAEVMPYFFTSMINRD